MAVQVQLDDVPRRVVEIQPDGVLCQHVAVRFRSPQHRRGGGRLLARVSKVNKAEKLNVPILNEQEFEHLLATGELPPGATPERAV